MDNSIKEYLSTQGRKGGNANKKKGTEYFRKIGKLGLASKRAKKIAKLGIDKYLSNAVDIMK